jgi:hypothetical protein
MTEQRGSIWLELTPEQKEKIRKVTGKMPGTLELSIMELEERIAPGFRTAG